MELGYEGRSSALDPRLSYVAASIVVAGPDLVTAHSIVSPRIVPAEYRAPAQLEEP